MKENILFKKNLVDVEEAKINLLYIYDKAEHDNIKYQ